MGGGYKHQTQKNKKKFYNPHQTRDTDLQELFDISPLLYTKGGLPKSSAFGLLVGTFLQKYLHRNFFAVIFVKV